MSRYLLPLAGLCLFISIIFFIFPRGLFIYQNSTDLRYDDFISQVKSDLNIKIPSKVVVNYYYPLYASLDIENHHLVLKGKESCIIIDSYIIMVRGLFYDDLSDDERKAILAHEISHMVDDREMPCIKNKLYFSEQEITQKQIKADTLAAKYVGPEVMLSVLNKTIIDSRQDVTDNFEINQRIANLQILISQEPRK